MSTINDRIKLLIKDLKMNNNSFSKSIGLSASTSINNITGGRFSKPSFDMIESILLIYNSIDANWLIKGEGNMYKLSSEKSNKMESNLINFEDPEIKYSVCQNCNHKQQIIDLQNERIKTLEQLIESKEEMISTLKTIQKP